MLNYFTIYRMILTDAVRPRLRPNTQRYHLMLGHLTHITFHFQLSQLHFKSPMALVQHNNMLCSILHCKMSLSLQWEVPWSFYVNWLLDHKEHRILDVQFKVWEAPRLTPECIRTTAPSQHAEFSHFDSKNRLLAYGTGLGEGNNTRNQRHCRYHKVIYRDISICGSLKRILTVLFFRNTWTFMQFYASGCQTGRLRREAREEWFELTGRLW